ncbi:MAG: copper amine oxidase N-terminal domain-containing protein [Thermacetogeniaceae bacterium]
MRRKILLAVCLSMLMTVLPAWAYGAAVFSIGSRTYNIDGRDQSMDVAPYIESGRTYLPVRYIASAVGVTLADISWNGLSRQVVITKGDRRIQLTVGSKTMILNGVPVQMDVAPELPQGRIMLPVRFLAQALGIDLSWNPATNAVIVGDLPAAVPQPGSIITVPPLQYDSSVSTTGMDFTWQYRDESFNWHAEIPQSLLNWDRQVNQLASDYYSGQYSQSDLFRTMPDNVRQLVLADSEQESGDLAPWVKDDDNSQWAGVLADRLAACALSQGLDYWHTAEFIQSFVGGAITYQLTDVPELPAQTVADNGDCKDKSILLAAILENLSYKVTLLEFDPGPGETGHMAVGVAFDDSQIPGDRNLSYYSHQGLKYYFAETTSPNWALGKASVKQPARVYDVN